MSTPESNNEIADFRKAIEEASIAAQENKESSIKIIDEISPLVKSAELVVEKLQKIIDLRIEGPRAAEIFDHAEYGTIIVDEGGIIKVVNEIAEKMFGYGTKELLGENLIKLMPDRYIARHQAKQHSYFANPSTRLFRRLEGKKKDGTEFVMDIALHPLESLTKMKLVLALLKVV